MSKLSSETSADHYLDWGRRGHISIWRYLVVILGGYLAGMLGAIPVVLLIPSAFADPFNRGVFLQWTFLPGLITILLLGRFLLGRPAWSLLSPAWPMRLKHFLVGAGIGLFFPLLMLVLEAGAVRDNFVGFDAYRRLGLLLLLVLVAGYVIQVAFEEILYRGAVMQFAWRIKAWTPFALVLQSALFAVPHFGNVKSWGDAGILSIAPYALVALGWGWICWRTGSLLVSMGLHFANNISGMLIVGSKDDALTSYAPILVARSSLAESTVSIMLHVGFSVGAVELWLWLRSRKRSQA